MSKEKPAPGTCKVVIDEKICGKPVVAKEMCGTCYQQNRRTGSPHTAPKVEVDDIIPLRMDGPLSKAIRAQAEKEEVAMAEWIRRAAREKLERKPAKR